MQSLIYIKNSFNFSFLWFFLDEKFDLTKDHMVIFPFPENIIAFFNIEDLSHLSGDSDSVFSIYSAGSDNFIFHKVRIMNLYKKGIWEKWKMGNTFILSLYYEKWENRTFPNDVG